MTPEGKIKNEIKKQLKRYPAVYYFMPVQAGYGAKTLDFLLCVDKYFVAIEAKAPGKKPTPLQEATMREIQNAGGVVFVIDTIEKAQALGDFIRSLYDHHEHQPGTSQPQTQNARRPRRPRNQKLVPECEGGNYIQWDPAYPDITRVS
jgi:hypothetical protein